jgi:drug/metabolite transporter (DMT)-like permease
LLAAAIQKAGGALPTMIIGTLPVVIAVVSNLRDAQRDGRLPWLRLAPSLLLIAAGIALVNHAELARLRAQADVDLAGYAAGALLAVGAVICWTWYPIRNADWLRAHAGRSPRTWATAQGVVTLPMALVGAAALWATGIVNADQPLGPTPERFVLLMLAIGLFASWLGTLCWNEASQRLPTTIAGQLIVFETLAALAYVFALRGAVPPPPTLTGIALLIAGVIWALRVKPKPVAQTAPR